MKFTPKTQQQLDEALLWPVGTYSYEIINAEDRLSKKGNEMIALKLQIFNDEGGHAFVDDYLLEAMAHKLRNAARACGLIDKYEAGHLEAYDFLNKTGKVTIKIDKSKDPAYSDKNTVAKYLEPDAGDAAELDLDDKLPF